jgi:hypothetical protein
MSALWGGGLWGGTGWGGSATPAPPGPCVPTTERAISADLQAILSGVVLHPARLCRVAPKGRTAFGYTTHNQDIAYDDGNGSITYQAIGNASPSSSESTTGLDTNATDVAFIVDAVTIARILIRWYQDSDVDFYLVDYENLSAGHVKIAAGKLAALPTDDVMVNANVQSLSAIINRSVDHSTTNTCPYARFGAGFCANGSDVGGLSDGPTAAVLSGTIGAVVSRYHLQLSGITCDADFAAGGVIFFPDNPDWPDFPFDVRSNGEDAADLYFSVPLPFLPEVGDNVDLEEGCLRTWEACIAHSATINFGGQLLPSPQILVKTQIGT